MSHDVTLSITDALGDEHWMHDRNYTSNAAGMWADALGYPLADMHGRRAGDCVTDLRNAVTRMDDDRSRYEAMNPPNGWGNAQGARDYLADLLDSCRRWPDGKIEVSF